MTIVDIARGQQVRIPAIQLTNGREFTGMIKASDGETLVIEVDERVEGRVPEHVDDLCVLTWVSEGIQRACPIIVRNTTTRALVGQVVIQERREAPRVRVDVQVSYETIPPAKVKEVAEEVMARVNTADEPESEARILMRNGDDPIAAIKAEMATLREMMAEILMKIEDLTAIAVGGAPAQAATNRTRTPLCVINCSSTGVGFIAADPQQEGDYLRIHLMLRTTPKTNIECMGVVVRCTPLDKKGDEGGQRRYDIGVRFTHIHEVDREHLIHYLFKVQRRLLRDLKEARDSMGRG